MRWKKIEGYEKYSVSDTGLIRNENTGRYLTFCKDRYGYFHTSLSKNGVVKQFGVHRIVAKAFVPNPNCLATVDHKNGNKVDNNASNLQWLSNEDNLEKYWKTHRKPVICLESGVVYPSAYQAAAELGLSPSHIREVCHKQRKSEKNLHFEYYKGEEIA